MSRLKIQFGLSPADEVKWNGMTVIPRKKREELSEELVSLLGKSIALVVICEGRDKQASAKLLIEQIAACLQLKTHILVDQNAIQLIFDEGIVVNQPELKQFVQLQPVALLSVATIASVDSKLSAVVQLADVYAGFNRRATTIALGDQRNPELRIWDDGMTDNISIDLLNYISISFRYAMWGEVPPPEPPDDFRFTGEWPFKHVGGYGLRIHSGISTETVERIYKSRVVYMGCMH